MFKAYTRAARIAYDSGMPQRTLIATITAVCVLLLAGWGVYAWLDDQSSVNSTLDVQLGKVRLAIPSTYIRNPEARRAGEFLEIELAASASDFRPAPRPRKLRPDLEDASAGTIYLNLREQEKTIDPSERPARLYVRFLEAEQWTHPGGLVLRHFESASPFGREDLYMAPPEGRVFAARCMRPQQPPDGLPNTCIAEIRLQGLDLRMRFSPELLSDWERITLGVRGLVHSLVR